MTLRIFALTLTVALAGCEVLGLEDGGEENSLENIDARASTWAANAPDAYSFFLERLCFCVEASRGPVQIVVEDGVVVSRRYAADGEPVPAELEELFPRIDGLFDVLRDAARRDADLVRVTWSDAFGFPATVFIDWIEEAIDDELTLRVFDFAPQ